MKILYVINKMTNLAGIERILTCKMNYLSEKSGYSVYLVTYEQPNQTPSFKFKRKDIILSHQCPHSPARRIDSMEVDESLFLCRKSFQIPVQKSCKRHTPRHYHQYRLCFSFT